MRAVGIFAVALLAVGCERAPVFDAGDSASASPPSLPEERSAFISVSHLSPAPGGMVVVAGTVVVGEGTSLGSYRVRLAYDSTKLRLLGEVEEPGVMRVVNPRPGEVIVAGASSGGSADGRLFALRFLAEDPAGLQSLVLHLDEINDAGYRNQTRGITRSARLVEDSTLNRGREIPR